MLLQHKKVAIIGGGPGGLTLARLLQQKGIDVQVYERDKDQTVRQQGATLDLHEESGLKALEAGGLLEEFQKHYRPGADKLRITDKNATIRMDDHLPEAKKEDFRPEIDRGPLRDMLIASLQTGTMQWNSYIVELRPAGEGWELIFDNGNTSYADLLVVADGANSKFRKYITTIKPVYSGITIVEGTIYRAAQNAPKLWELVKGGKVFALGSEKTLILSAKGDGSLSFYTGTKEAEHWVTDSGIDFGNKQQIRTWFSERFSDWSSDWKEVFASDESYFVPRPQYHYPLDQSWKPLPNLTMLGDAAHRMPPYAGEGVNQAMHDALDLYEALCLAPHATHHDAIATFEKNMCARAAQITEETLQNTELMHSADGLEQMLHFFSQSPV